jgi:membrane-associated phospholipid phosphatase
MRNFLTALLLSLLFSTQAFAWGMKELGEEAASPYTDKASRYTLFAGSFLTLGFAIFEDSVGDPFQEKQVRNKTLGHSSGWGDLMGQMVPNILYVGGMSIAGFYQDPKGYERAIGMFKATAYAASVTTILKYTIREPRPNDNSTKNSFPSGHSTTVFAFSGYVAAEHGWGWGSAALTLAFFTAHSRINDNMHRLHDVTAGATIGWVYGWGMAKLQKRKANEDKEAFIAPILDSQTAGLSLYKEF